MKKSLAIIGSGPASLMLAATLDETLFNVTIYERNFAPARKFLVAGDGGFNLTHSEELEFFISRYEPSTFLEECIRSFTNTDLQNWLKQIGIETYIGSSKRIFPVKEIKPIHVLNAILDYLKTKQVNLKMKHEWKGWNTSNELLFVNDSKELIVSADIVVFALGGASWSKTGSDGTWTNYFKSKSIDTIPFQPSNCAYQINWDKNFIHSYEGQPLKNISIHCNGKEKKGEVVLTQFGIEGGAVYALSSKIRKQLNEGGKATIFIDLKPTFNLDEIENKLVSSGYRTVSKALDAIKLSKRQIALLRSVLSKEDFTDAKTLSKSIKQLPIQIIGMAPIDEAISTVGGISLLETDDHFQLKKLPNHYAIGEMLDWDAPTGGYLLQACFSMGNFLGKKLNDK